MRSGVVCRVTDNAQRLESAAAAPAAKAREINRREELLRFSRQMQTHVKRYMNTVFHLFVATSGGVCFVFPGVLGFILLQVVKC